MMGLAPGGRYARSKVAVISFVLVALAIATMYLGAQTFPRDSQTIGGSRRRPPVDDSQRSIDESQQRDIDALYARMNAHDTLSAETLAGIEKRLARIEDIKPDVVVLRVENLESSATKIIALLLGIFATLLLNFWSSWTKRSKGSA
jgi:hypothetical protein